MNSIFKTTLNQFFALLLEQLQSLFGLRLDDLFLLVVFRLLRLDELLELPVSGLGFLNFRRQLLLPFEQLVFNQPILVPHLVVVKGSQSRFDLRVFDVLLQPGNAAVVLLLRHQKTSKSLIVPLQPKLQRTTEYGQFGWFSWFSS